MKWLRVAGAAPTSFAIDRERFAEATREALGDLEGIETPSADEVTMALTSRFEDAREARAIVRPPGLEVFVYALTDSLIVTVREPELLSDLPEPGRQLATISFEAKHILSSEDRSFEDACAGIEELLDRANSLLPSFWALRRGERGLRRDGRRRRLTRRRRFGT